MSFKEEAVKYCVGHPADQSHRQYETSPIVHLSSDKPYGFWEVLQWPHAVQKIAQQELLVLEEIKAPLKRHYP